MSSMAPPVPLTCEIREWLEWTSASPSHGVARRRDQWGAISEDCSRYKVGVCMAAMTQGVEKAETCNWVTTCNLPLGMMLLNHRSR